MDAGDDVVAQAARTERAAVADAVVEDAPGVAPAAAVLPEDRNISRKWRGFRNEMPKGAAPTAGLHYLLRMAPVDDFPALSHELRQERTAALRISTERLEAALNQLAAADAGSREWEAHHREAERLLWYLVVQRESLGLHRHDTVYEVLRIPASVQPHWTPE